MSGGPGTTRLPELLHDGTIVLTTEPTSKSSLYLDSSGITPALKAHPLYPLPALSLYNVELRQNFPRPLTKDRSSDQGSHCPRLDQQMNILQPSDLPLEPRLDDIDGPLHDNVLGSLLDHHEGCHQLAATF